MPLTVEQRALRDMKKSFTLLTTQVRAYIAQLDVVMAKDNSPFGEKVAELSNKLEMANDIAARFGLGLDSRGKKLKQGQ